MILLVILDGSLSFALTAQAGERVLTLNSGDASSPFTIQGEPSLIINGFDLQPLGLRFPATIDRVSIAVDAAPAGASVTAVVYQDTDGGSPVNATLAGQFTTTITQPGVFTAVFPTPVSVNAPVVWVGFYLPVNFRFLADRSGTSVLTYWAWTPGTTFDLNRLSSAQVLGPANGTTPVGLNMGGIARITAEISNAPGGPTAGPGTPTVIAGTPIPGRATQIASTGSEPMNVMRFFPPACDTLAWDTEDIGISYNGSISVRCTAIWNGYAPPAPAGYQRLQLYYDVTFYDVDGDPISTKLDVPVTHCMKPNPADVNGAIIGIASGVPRTWEILPTLRVGELVCAEIYKSGGLSYLVPVA
jgi:hypothetical protein